MNIIKIIIRGIICIIYLFFLLKMVGKKQISELNTFDYVVGLSLGNTAADITVDLSSSLIEGMAGMFSYCLVSVFISYITMKSIKARRFITGVPIVIINDGKIIKENLKRCRIDINDLLQDAREDGFFDISEINYAVMESSGKISFLPYSKYMPVTPNDLGINVSNNSLVANLIIDGKIMYDNLKNINRDVNWLNKQIKNYDIKELLLVTCDINYKVNIYKMNEENQLIILE